MTHRIKTIQQKTLSQMTAEEAEERIGQDYYDPCGDFIKELLEMQGIIIEKGPGGGLRHFGSEVPFAERGRLPR